MNKGWQTKKLGDVLVKTEATDPTRLPQVEFDYIDVSSVSNATLAIQETQLLKGKDAPSRARRLVKANDVLFATIRPTLRRIAIVPEKLDNQVCSTGYFVLRAKSDVNHRFVFYFLQTEDFMTAMETLQKGASYPAVTDGDVRSQPIPIPPLSEQQRIVGILDEAFAGITTAKANAEKNRQNARALFESHLQSVFTQRGSGWMETTIGAACTLKSGTTVSPTLETPVGDIPYLKVADMTFGGNEDQITTSSRFLSKADVKMSAIIPEGATIFPKRGGAILTNKKRITSVPICADLNIMAVIPSTQIDAQLLYFYFLNVDMRKLGTGSSIPQINNYDIAPLLISFPEAISEQRKIIKQLADLREETQHLASLYEKKLAALEALKKSLLHQAFTGEL